MFMLETKYHTRTPQGRRLRGTGGIVPLKKLGGGDGSAFIPPIFRKCLADLQCVKTNKNKKEDETHVTRDRHTTLSYSTV